MTKTVVIFRSTLEAAKAKAAYVRRPICVRASERDARGDLVFGQLFPADLLGGGPFTEVVFVDATGGLEVKTPFRLVEDVLIEVGSYPAPTPSA